MLNGGGAGVVRTGVSADAHGLFPTTSALMLLRGLAGLAVNAFMAFALNVVSFHTNRKVGALGMSVAGMCSWHFQKLIKLNWTFFSFFLSFLCGMQRTSNKL